MSNIKDTLFTYKVTNWFIDYTTAKNNYSLLANECW